MAKYRRVHQRKYRESVAADLARFSYPYSSLMPGCHPALANFFYRMSNGSEFQVVTSLLIYHATPLGTLLLLLFDWQNSDTHFLFCDRI